MEADVVEAVDRVGRRRVGLGRAGCGAGHLEELDAGAAVAERERAPQSDRRYLEAEPRRQAERRAVPLK